MKVAIIGTWAQPELGGGYTLVQELEDALVRLPLTTDNELVLFSARADELQAHRRADHGVTVRPSPVADRSLVGRARRRLEQEARGMATGLTGAYVPPHQAAWQSVLVDEGFQLQWCLGMYLGTLEVPFLFPIWDLQHRLQPWFPEVSQDGEWGKREASLRTIVQRSTKTLTGTEVGRAEVVRFFQVPRERVAVLPHPTPQRPSTTGEGAQRLLDRIGVEGQFLFYPAQLWSHKNHATLVHALKLLADDGRRLPLVCTGADKGNEAHVLQQARDLGVADLVHLVGFVERDVVWGLYERAAALTYASLFGPENLPPLEAFEVGCPVIVADVDGAEEQLGDGALRVAATDPGGWAKAIARVLDESDLRARLCEEGVAIAESRPPTAFAQQGIALLDELAPLFELWG